jgi:hypothetical protein
MVGLLSTLLLTAGLSLAQAECPLGTIQGPTATMMTVTVSGEVYLVSGYTSRTAFRSALVACGELEAAEYFSRWRQMRRWTNASLLLAIPTAGVSLIVAAVTGLQAGVNRELMLVAMMPDQAM